MAGSGARVEKFSSDRQTTWMTDSDRGEFGFPLPYDEVFVVTKGSFTVRTGEEEVTAQAGEVLYLWAGLTGEYYAYRDAEVVAVTYPPYRRALREAGHGEELDQLVEVEIGNG